MSFITKRFIRCDSCGKTVQIETDLKSLGLGGMAAKAAGLEGWIDALDGHQLCPMCAEPYLAKKREMERELRRLAGVEVIETSI